mmetsp:Transcript_48819/g.118151  ORF Transcript_48819/g.118151 Transcript_48819/m.118151 type:complete len:762 (+) Transcript_48819:211-2496(+)
MSRTQLHQSTLRNYPYHNNSSNRLVSCKYDFSAVAIQLAIIVMILTRAATAFSGSSSSRFGGVSGSRYVLSFVKVRTSPTTTCRIKGTRRYFTNNSNTYNRYQGRYSSGGGGGGNSSNSGNSSSRRSVPSAPTNVLSTSPWFSTSSEKKKKIERDPGLECTSVISYPKEVPAPKGLPTRTEQVERLKQIGQVQEYEEQFDILVVGGGATGAGIALDSAVRGLKTACIERGDFSSETSSRSTKLIWAGIKYMATASAMLLSTKLVTNPLATVQDFVSEMKMVFNCHQERKFMMQQQEHLCNWIPIVIPFTSWHVSPPPFNHPLFGFFPVLAPPVLKFYDALSQFTCPPSFIMTPTKVKTKFPQLEESTLKYCAVFYEAQHNDARTNIAIALTAAERGASIANYVEMVDVITDDNDNKKVIGVKATDRMTGKTFEIRAKKVIFAGGPFTDKLRELEEGPEEMKPAVNGGPGTHIVLPGYLCPSDMGLLDYNTSDGRFLFMLPWMGHTLVGTTDKKSPAETLPAAPEDEVEWLLKECSKYLSPDVQLRRSDVLSTWRGWRPLAVDPHAPPGAPVSRDHIISENPDTGVIFIAGGKWTTWREMAQDVVDRIVGSSGPECTTLDIKLFGGDGYKKNLSIELIQKFGMPQDVAEHLVNTYGARSWEVCDQIDPSSKKKWSDFGTRLAEGFPYLDLDVVWACREYACTIEDVLSRRTRLAFLNKEAALQAIPMVADIMAKELGWSGRVKKQQIAAAEKYIGSYGGRIP